MRLTLAEGQKTFRRGAWSQDGRLLAVPGDEPLVRIWEVTGGTIHKALPLDGPASTVAFWPGGFWLAVGNLSPEIDKWYLGTKTGTRQLPSLFRLGENRFATSIAVSPDGKMLVAGSNSGRIHVWDVENQVDLHSFPGHTTAVQALAFRPGTPTFVSGSQDHHLAIWEASSGKRLRRLQGHTGSVYAAAWSPDGSLLASGSADCTVRLWNPDRSPGVLSLEGHTGAVVGVSFSSDGRLLASKSFDGTVRLWRSGTGEAVAILPATANDRNVFGTVAFHPSEPRLVFSTEEDTVLQIWDIDEDLLLANAQAPATPPAEEEEAERADQVVQERPRVFISYSRKDRVWLERLLTMLSPLDHLIDIWYDERIPPGADWEREILEAVASARVVVPLVSADYLASKFVKNTELPALQVAAEQQGTKILWVYVGPSYFREIPMFRQYQAAYDPQAPLKHVTDPNRVEIILLAIVEKIVEAALGKTE